MTGSALLSGCASSLSSSDRLAKLPRLGYLQFGTADGSPQFTDTGSLAFGKGLLELGYLEGTNVVIERRSAEGRADRLWQLAVELVQQPVDVLVAGDSLAIPPARKATGTIPIVMTVIGDPVGQGYVASLAHPGGNVTGLSNSSSQLVGKRLQLLIEADPNLSDVAVLGPDGHPEWPDVRAAARALNVHLVELPTREPDDFDGAIRAAVAARVAALAVLPSPGTNQAEVTITQLAAQRRLPCMGPLREYAVAGALLAYGPNIPDLFYRAATYVDKILKGTKPAEIPVERPTTFELVINLKTARELGLTIPPSVLQQTTEVIH